MKKASTQALIYIFISLIFYSCTKNVAENVVQNQGPKKTRIGLDTKKPKYKHFENKACDVPALNCTKLKEIVVRPPHLTGIKNAINEGSLAIGNLFSSNEFIYICNELDDELVAKLKSGYYNLKINYEDDVKISFMGGNQSPLVFSNAEFSIEFDK